MGSLEERKSGEVKAADFKLTKDGPHPFDWTKDIANIVRNWNLPDTDTKLEAFNSWVSE